MQKPTVLITGGNGFIGKKLTDALLLEGYQVRITSRRKPKHPSINPSVKTVQVDYNDPASLRKALKGCIGVFHLAAAIFGFKKEDFEKANVAVTRNLVRAVNMTPGIKAFVHVSSLAAAGFAADKEGPLTEEAVRVPVSDYGITKLQGEKELLALKPSVKRVVLRPPIVYGKNDSGVSKIAAWVKRGIMVNTSGNGCFSFVYVDDLVKALVTAFKIPDTNGQTYFIAEDDCYSWDYFISEMANAMGKRKPIMPNAPYWLLRLAAWGYETTAKVFHLEPALNYDKIKEAAIPGHWICSNKKWKKLTGQHFTPLREGLKKSFGK